MRCEVECVHRGERFVQLGTLTDMCVVVAAATAACQVLREGTVGGPA
jgi:hypothetical protein